MTRRTSVPAAAVTSHATGSYAVSASTTVRPGRSTWIRTVPDPAASYTPTTCSSTSAGPFAGSWRASSRCSQPCGDGNGDGCGSGTAATGGGGTGAGTGAG